MAQFRVYRLPGGRLVLDLQPDVVGIPTRVVAPLEPPSPALRPFTHLEPVFEIEGGRLALHAGELAAVPARLVSGEPVADLRCEDYAIRRALDMLLSGFWRLRPGPSPSASPAPGGGGAARRRNGWAR